MIFLRPWFLLLLSVPFLLFKFQEKRKSQSIWKKLISPALLPYLLVMGETKFSKRGKRYQTILWMFLVLGLAGPAWYKKPLPVRNIEPSTVIVLELGPMMVGETLTKAKQKINDALDNLKGEQVALVLYDRKGYTAAPLSFDFNIIKELLPGVELGILPNATTIQMVAGMQKAENIFKSAGVKKGRILLLTAGADPEEAVLKWAKLNQHPVGVLVVGAKDAHPIALSTGGFLRDTNDNIIMIKPDFEKWSTVGFVQAITPDASDVQNLIEKTSEDVALDGKGIKNMELWQDMGGWFVALSLPFFMWLFRRHIVVLFLFISCSAQASLWLRPDQESYLRQEEGIKVYRQGLYEKAADLFSSGFNADDIYNWGNALAHQQKIEEAIDAYKQVLEENPNHADALFNKEYLEEKIKEQEEQKEIPLNGDYSEDQPSKEEPPEKQLPEKSPLKKNTLQEEQSEMLSETQKSKEQYTEEQSFEKQRMEGRVGQQVERQKTEEMQSTEDQNTPFDQNDQQVLNQLPEIPPSLLKYRLKQQYNRYLKE